MRRKDALAQGLKFYFTNKPCRRGHVSKRYTRGGHCVECLRERGAQNRDYHKKVSRKSYLKHRDQQIAEGRERYQKNKEEVIKRTTQYAQDHPEQMWETRRRWYKKNLAKYRYYNALRRARIKKRTPAWADLKAIKKIYLKCGRISEETGIPHHVDHIIPLCGKKVCGLHVETNLRIIPASENHRKANRHVAGNDEAC